LHRTSSEFKLALPKEIELPSRFIDVPLDNLLLITKYYSRDP
jgi:hypothetical protein